MSSDQGGVTMSERTAVRGYAEPLPNCPRCPYCPEGSTVDTNGHHETNGGTGTTGHHETNGDGN